MDEGELKLSYKKGSTGRESVDPPSWKVLAGYLLASATQFGYTVHQATTTIDGAYHHEPLSVKDVTIQGYRLKDHVAEHIDKHISAYAGAALPVANVTAAAAQWIKQKLKEDANSKTVDAHPQADGEISLNENGVGISADANKELVTLVKDYGISLESQNNKIEIEAQKEIAVTSRGSDIKLTATSAIYGKTKIKQKNFMAD
jgi:hypothetical protein